MNHSIKAALALVLLIGTAGCEEYLAPPEPRLNAPPNGTFKANELLDLRFETPIVPETLIVSVYNDTRNVERELPSDSVPILANCTVATSPCDAEGTTLTVAEDGLSAALYLNPEGIGKPDVPLLVQIEPGLEDAQTGGVLNYPEFFNFQFTPEEVTLEPVAFQSGHYVVVAEFEVPIKNVLSLLSDLSVTDDNRFVLIGAEADNFEGTNQNTRDAADMYVDVSDMGFVAFAEGRIRQNDRGERFVETGEFSVTLRLGPITVALSGLKIDAKVVQHPVYNNDQLVGTLSYQAIEIDFGANVTSYPAGGTTFDASQIPEGDVPEGTPTICGNPCGSVPDQCVPPADFPPVGFCDDGESDGSGDLEGSGE